MYRARIISGFPGVGKSYVFNKAKELGLVILDSDSSAFSWSSEGIRNPNFPNNYIEHIKNNMNTADLILVSSHAEVRTALKEAGLRYYLCYPDLDTTDKELYMDLLRHRGSSDSFVNLISSNWVSWVGECETEEYAIKIPIKAAHVHHLIEYVIAMFKLENKAIISKNIIKRSIKEVKSIEAEFTYDDGGYYKDRITVGDLVTVTHFKNGRSYTIYGKVRSISEAPIRRGIFCNPITGEIDGDIRKFILQIDASTSYNTVLESISTLDIVSIFKGEVETIIIPDIPVELPDVQGGEDDTTSSTDPKETTDTEQQAE